MICFTNTSSSHCSGDRRDDRGRGGEGGECGCRDNGCRGSEDGGSGGGSSDGRGGDSGIGVEFKDHFF